MKDSIETRELITVGSAGAILRATHHKARGSATADRRGELVGILFLNSLFPTRAATGDSAVYWAESFALAGYPSFRIDLPGFGDADGDTPAELLKFINDGGYACAAANAAQELVARFDLRGMVIVGLCAGAVTALFAAAACRECKGLVMMDPYFHLPQAAKSRVGRRLTHWSYRSKVASLLCDTYARLQQAYLRIRRAALPENANTPLLNCWKKVASSGLPILVLKAPCPKSTGIQPPTGEFDYLKYVLQMSGRLNQVVVQLINGTDHSFANRVGRVAVRLQAQAWLSDHFPQKDTSEPVLAPVTLDQAKQNQFDQCVTA